MTYFTFFTLGFLCYAGAPTLATLGMLGVFAAAFCLIASMYGGGFATIPAYLADIFGTQFVGAIHGRLLTAWSTAGIVGPVIVNYMHDSRKAEGVSPDQIYHPIFYVLAGLLVAGFIANLLIRPLDKKWFMKPEEVEALPGVESSWRTRQVIGQIVGGPVSFLSVSSGSRPPDDLFTPVIIEGRQPVPDRVGEVLQHLVGVHHVERAVGKGSAPTSPTWTLRLVSPRSCASDCPRSA